MANSELMVVYPLVMTNSLLLKPWPIEIVDLPLKDNDFSSSQTVSQPEAKFGLVSRCFKDLGGHVPLKISWYIISPRGQSLVRKTWSSFAVDFP